jgi:hypothetical protein
MKHFLLSISILIAFKTGFSQSDLTPHYFKEIGLSIKVPSKFEIVESDEDEKLRLKGEKLLEGANNVQIDASSMKNLLSIKQGQFNYMNITVTPYKETSEDEWEKQNKEVKNMLYKSFVEKVTLQNIDTTSTSINVDGVLFDRFEMTIRINSSMTMKMLLLSKFYKGYDFGIAYTYLDKAIGKELDNIVHNAKFEK